MKKVRNYIIGSFALLGFSFLYRRYVMRGAPLVRVIVFHDVQDREWFTRIIGLLVQKTHLLTPAAFAMGEFHPKKMNVLITFDDGYESWIRICLPVLETHDIQSIFFLNSGLLALHDTAQVQNYVRDKLCLTTERHTIDFEAARTLFRSGQTIGGHTTNHVRLSTVDDATAHSEIISDKETLERECHNVLTHFAYPFGNTTDFTTTSVQMVKAAGYTHAYTTVPSFYRKGMSPFEIPRLCIEETISPRAFLWWIHGAYDLWYRLKKVCVR